MSLQGVKEAKRLRKALEQIASAPADRVTAGFLIELAKDALRQ